MARRTTKRTRLTHERMWAAIDALARLNGLSTSGLAKAAGLDPTAFNKSKRIIEGGRARWPSAESLARAMDATDTSIEEFIPLLLADDAEKML